MITEKHVDVVSVGGGYTASILAWKLTAAGLNMVSLEQGPERWANPDYQMDHDPLRFDVRKLMMVDLAKETWTWRPNPNAPALPYRQFGSFDPGMGIGGSAVHWSGMLWRYLQTDFKYRSHVIDRYGASKLPEGNRIQDWPVTYEDLEPYYDEHEHDIGASGKAGNVNGAIIPGGNPFEAPRSRPYPLPPLVSTIMAEKFAKTTESMGYHPFPQPAGIASRAFTDRFGNFRSGCIYCGYCTRYGCEVDAKTSSQTTWLPVALKTGRYTVRTQSKVTGIKLAADGRATGVTYVDSTGQEHYQPADIVLLTAYPLTNVRMLLLSRNHKHPHGIGNDHGYVGKNYTYQNWHDIAYGLFPKQKFNLFMGNTATIQVIYDFASDVFDHSTLGFIGGSQIFSGLGEHHPVAGMTGLPMGTDAAYPGGKSPMGIPTWGKQFKEYIKQYGDSIATITMQGESLPYEDQFMDLDPTYKDAYGRPLLRLTFDWHPNDFKMVDFMVKKAKEIMKRMGASQVLPVPLSPYNIYTYQSTHITGGAIMGDSPANSVTNKYGQVWDTPNVFVTGAALYPQNPNANPTGTLGPLAYMAGDAIVTQYVKSPNKLMS